MACPLQVMKEEQYANEVSLNLAVINELLTPAITRLHLSSSCGHTCKLMIQNKSGHHDNYIYRERN